VRVISSPRGVSVQRNHGAANARAANLVFLDADCLVPPNWLRGGLADLEEGAALTGGPVQKADNATWVGRAWQLHWDVRQQRLQQDPDHWCSLITTQNLFVRRQTFLRIGGFDESLTAGEDVFFCTQVRRLNEKIVFDPDIPVRHLGLPRTLRAFFRQQVWYSNFEVRRRLLLLGVSSLGRGAYHYALLTTLLLGAIVVGGVLSIATRQLWPILVAVGAYLMVPAALSLRTCAGAQSLRSFFPLIISYSIFGLARAVSWLGIFRVSYRRTSPDPSETRPSDP